MDESPDFGIWELSCVALRVDPCGMPAVKIEKRSKGK